MDNDLKTKVLNGLIWRFLQQFSTQIVQFLIQVILARILMPHDFGLVILVTVFINIAKVFVDGGFGQALIQSKHVTNADLSTIFYLNILVSVVMYSLIFLVAPYVANFYGIEILSSLLRVQATVILIEAFVIVQNALMLRNMLFKHSFLRSGVSILAQGITGVTLALLGFGVWALVCGHIVSSVVSVMVLWATIKWRPSRAFGIHGIKGLIKYGIGILGTNLVNTTIANVYSLVIGKAFTAQMLGYYNRGDQFPSLAAQSVTEPLTAVIFPTMSRMQGSIYDIKSLMRLIMIMGSFITFPLMMLMAVIAEPIVILLLTEKWILCVPFVQLACIKYAFSPIHSANLQAVKAIGRSDIFLKLSLVKNSITILLLIVSVPFGIYAVAISGVIGSLLHLLINIVPNIKLIDYSLREQLADIIPNAVLTLLTGGVAISIKLFNLDIYPTMLIQIAAVFSLYFIIAKLLNMRALNESKKLLSNISILMSNNKAGHTSVIVK